MKARKVSEMVAHVRGILERNMITTQQEGWQNVETLSLNNLIREMLTEAVDIVADRAPVDMFSDVSEAEFGGSGTGPLSTVVLDDDASRIVEIHCDTWEHDVTILTAKDNPLYKQAKNKWCKTVGVYERPIVVPGMSGGGIRILELYPAGNKLEVYYVPKAEIFTDDEDVEENENGEFVKHEQINCDKMLYESACWYAAYLVAMAQNLPNQKGYLDEAMRRIGLDEQSANS